MMNHSRLIAASFSTAGLVAGMIALGAPAVMAQSACQAATGGSTSSVAYTGKTSGNSSQGYTCAYESSRGKGSLSPWQTKSWTSNTAAGYYRIKDCTGTQGSSVTLAPAYATTAFGSSWTQTATNWSVSSTAYWGPGIFWATDSVASSQWSTTTASVGCNWGNFPTNLFWTTKTALTLTGYNKTSGAPTFTVAVTPEGNAPAGSVAGVFQMLGDTPAPDTDKAVAGGTLIDGAITATSQYPFASGEYTFYAVYGGSGADLDPRVEPQELVPPQRGWLPSASDTITVTIDSGKAAAAAPAAAAPDPGTDPQPTAGDITSMSVVDVQSRYPALPDARCERGQRPIHVQGWSRRATIGDGQLSWGRNGASMVVGGLKKGTRLGLQLVCRPVGDKAERMGRLSLGTVRSDRVSLKKRGTIMAGPGADNLTVAKQRSNAFGAPGRDSITVKAAESAADGGPGPDVLKSTTKNPNNADGKRAGRAMLIGGTGLDQVTGGWGPDRINVMDGAPGDTVRCRGSENRVMADRGDQISGDCKRIYYP